MCRLVVLSVLAVGVMAGNPFEGKKLYVNPAFQKEIASSIATASGSTKTTLQAMQTIGSAYWLDVKAKVVPDASNTTTASGILADAVKSQPGSVVTLIVYDVPNRDCDAAASAGEICCTKNSDGTCDYTGGGDCSAGIQEYLQDYITPLANTLKQYCGKVPVVLVIEPDSLPNLATNMGNPHCSDSGTQAAYKSAIPQGMKILSAACPSNTMYLDAAHGGWLGWENNLQKFASLVQSLDIFDMLRGFSTNVANYQPLGTVACPTTNWCLNNAHPGDPCCTDPCNLISQYNPGNTEANYALELYTTFSQMGFTPAMITDTGRNGVGNMRSDCSHWCNIRGAGVGAKPTSDTINSTLFDAMLWLKTPGESDGCTSTLPSGQACPRYDSECGSPDSIGSRSGEPRAPTAGAWFDYEVKMLANNAVWKNN